MHAFRSVAYGLCAVVLLSAIGLAQTERGSLRSALRGNTPLNEVGPAPRMLPQGNMDLREVRNYPEQPPVIPHVVDAYQLDANVNQCLSCHARSRTGESQAPMVSITHFMDRDGQFLRAFRHGVTFASNATCPSIRLRHPSKIASSMSTRCSVLQELRNERQRSRPRPRTPGA
jgi:cytochrome c-type protein NapB